MKKLRLCIVMLCLAFLLCLTGLAKLHTYELISTDTLTYTLGEEDKLSATLIIDEDGLYEAKIRGLSTTGHFEASLHITIYDGSKEIFFFETARRSDAETDAEYEERNSFLIGLKSGNYEMIIENKTKFSDAAFTLETTFTETEYIEAYGNSSRENASEMDFKTKYFGAVSMFDETDYFTFTMPCDGYVFIEMYSPTLKYFSLYDEDENEIGYLGIKIDEENKVYSVRTGLAAGKYYIGVTPDISYSAPIYTIEVISYEGENLEKEYNNDRKNATPVSFGTEYQGNLFGIEDTDVYSFTLYDTSSVTIDFTDTKASADKRYSIVLSDGEKDIYSLAECEKRTIVLSLEKGTYYFTTSNSDRDKFSNMAYKLSVNVRNKEAANPPQLSEEGNATPESDIPEANEENRETVQFSDVAENKWYYDELLEAKALGLISGTGENLYNPDGSVSVAEIITMAARIKNANGGTNTPLENSPVGNWYNSYVTFAVNAGIIERDTFDNFDRNATRSEVACVFANLFDNAETTQNTLIPDVDQSTPHCDEIHKLYALGIVKGDADGCFRPNDTISRAEAAAILLRVHKA